jgi:hypothetical protein
LLARALANWSAEPAIGICDHARDDTRIGGRCVRPRTVFTVSHMEAEDLALPVAQRGGAIIPSTVAEGKLSQAANGLDAYGA